MVRQAGHLRILGEGDAFHVCRIVLLREGDAQRVPSVL